MKKLLLVVVFMITAVQSFAQRSFWKIWDSNKTITSERIRETPYSQNQLLLQFDAVSFKQTLANVPQKGSGQAGVEILLPNVKGGMEKFLVWESSNFEPELQAKYPEIRAYIGKGVTDPSARVNFSFDPKGIKTMIYRVNSGSEFIEPYTKDGSVYIVFDSATRYKSGLPFACGSEDVAVSEGLSKKLTNSVQSSDQTYKTMRLALSCTGEYGAYHGGTVGALAAMNATMTRCNAIFERDLAIKLLLIANNNLIVYANASTDPYSNATTGQTADATYTYHKKWNIELQNTLTNVIGDANYDIGHLFGATGGGGNAGWIGAVCVSPTPQNVATNPPTLALVGKGTGYTSPADGIPEGDSFDIDFVAHEMGHQMGGNHTFTHTTENNAVNVEPGSGTTIMAYAGVGDPPNTNIQDHSDDYFAFRSISQIQTNMATKTCPVSTDISSVNARPTVTVPGAYTIPGRTAFKLTGGGTGTAGETLSFCWEQNDDATTVGATASLPSATKTNGPNFRSLPPVAIPTRYFPKFSDVLAGNLTPQWEMLSSVSRNLSFALTVRDNVLGGGQTNTLTTPITVINTGTPFSITNPSVVNTSWMTGSTQTLTWDVAGTDANGINTANVNILISLDGGTTFTTLLANTPNDGSENITLPSTPSTTCRILVEAVGNIFYAVSKNIALGYNIVNACNTYTFSGTIPIIDQAPGSYTTRTLNVPITGTISDINVFNNITHTYLSDVQTDISSPQNPTTFVKLFNRSCNGSGTLNLKFSDDGSAVACSTAAQTVIPGQPLSAFNGQNPQGNWTFRVYDNYSGDTGTVNSWGIEVCTQTVTLSAPTNQLTDFAIYPNPNKGNFNIQFDNSASNEVKVNVYDMRGRTIFENKYSNQGIFNETIQLSNAQSGVYLVSVTDGTSKVVKRIVVE